MKRARSRPKIGLKGYRLKGGQITAKPGHLTEEEFKKKLRDDGHKGKITPVYWRGG
jgi:hypothetical protein